MAGWPHRSICAPVVSAHNSYMTEARFSAKQWQLHHADDWLTWIESSRTSRIKRMSRLAEGVRQLTLRWVASSEQAERVVLELPQTLGRCNELAFSSESETLAYTIWHLVDRYARIIQVLDELVKRGQLPLRKTRLSALEIGAGPAPALHAVRDFYADLVEWTSQLNENLELTPATHLLSLDRGAAWPHLVHNLSEELLLLGDNTGPHIFGISFADFESFSIQEEHREAIAHRARWLIADADAWDEYLEPSKALAQAVASHDYPPGEAGRFSTQSQHIAGPKISGVERGAAWLLGQVRRLGPCSLRRAEAMLQARGVEGVRVLQGLLNLAHRHPGDAIERACDVALSYGAYRLRTLRALLERQAPRQESLPFLEEHPLIRKLSDYGQFVYDTFSKEVKP